MQMTLTTSAAPQRRPAQMGALTDILTSITDTISSLGTTALNYDAQRTALNAQIAQSQAQIAQAQAAQAAANRPAVTAPTPSGFSIAGISAPVLLLAAGAAWYFTRKRGH